ncbi:MAG: hypothetical protein P8Y80_18040, partial [Acidobacteriota bacterium]
MNRRGSKWLGKYLLHYFVWYCFLRFARQPAFHRKPNKVEACIACAMEYGVVDQLKALGITVRGMGV